MELSRVGATKTVACLREGTNAGRCERVVALVECFVLSSPNQAVRGCRSGAKPWEAYWHSSLIGGTELPGSSRFCGATYGPAPRSRRHAACASRPQRGMPSLHVGAKGVRCDGARKLSLVGARALTRVGARGFTRVGASATRACRGDAAQKTDGGVERVRRDGRTINAHQRLAKAVV